MLEYPELQLAEALIALRLRGEVEISGDDGETITEPTSNLVVLDDATRTYRMPLTQDLPTNPEVRVTLENIFAPQSATGAIMLAPFTSDLTFEESALTPGSSGDEDTALE